MKVMSVSPRDLETFGLSEKEANIYLAALEIGRATADQLSKHTKIARPTTYLQIKSLMEMGLMSTYEEGKKTYFAPEAPTALMRVLENRKEEIRTSENLLTSLLPILTQQFEGAGERPIVRFFPGKEGVTTLRNMALAVKSKKHSFIYSYEGLSGLYTYEERKAYTEARISKGISVRSIVSTSEIDMVSGFPMTEILPVPANMLPIQTDILIWDDKLSIVLYKGTPFGALIESKEVAASFLATFDLLWLTLAEKFSIKK
jgi:sugar-specific transcriptional regulator TrmB